MKEHEQGFILTIYVNGFGNFFCIFGSQKYQILELLNK